MDEKKELKDQRIPIMMSASEVEALDEWAFQNRIRSRGEAIRRLCAIGLIVENDFDTVIDFGLALRKAGDDPSLIDDLLIKLGKGFPLKNSLLTRIRAKLKII